MKKTYYLFSFNFILWLSAHSLFAQQDKPSLSQAMSIGEYFDNILEHHPVVRQVRFLNELAQQEIRLARGNFDPKLKSKYDIKEFGGAQYYKTWDSKLEIPIWFNTDLNVGYERNDGEYLNEQLQNTSDGLLYAGVSVPLGRGLFTDERRTAVRQAELMQDMAAADQIKEINKVLFSAAKAYWDWYYAYQNYQLVNEVRGLAQERYSGIVQQVMNGDLAPFDSLKAFINYQERDLQQQQAELDYRNARIEASNFLWRTDSLDEQAIPLLIAENTYPYIDNVGEPETLDLLTLNTLLDSAKLNHPELIKINLKNQQLEIEQKLHRELLKPAVNLKYNVLLKPGEDDKISEINNNIFVNDYKFGMEVYFPLLLRKERAKLQKTNIKLEQNYFERMQQTRNIENEINIAFNTLNNLEEIILMQENMVNNYQALLNGELIKFENGESSIFLINTRETELLNSRVKLLKLQTEYEKAKIALSYAAGIPYLEI